MTHIVVVVKLVPDLVEELEIDASGSALDMTWLRLIINESDDHAIEQAILLKEDVGGRLTVLAPDYEGVDDVLYTAVAKGADQIIKVAGDFERVNNHALVSAVSELVLGLSPDLVLTGVQAHYDLDGSLGPLLAERIGAAYTGYVSAVSLGADRAIVSKEYPGGLIAQLEIRLPAVLGIQSAEKPPRYIAVSKVRQAMQDTVIETQPAGVLDPHGGLPVTRMFFPEVTEKAQMITGDEDEIATRLVEILREGGVF